jgi:hypothetical protein
MQSDAPTAPFVRWDGFHVAFDLDGVERRITRRLAGVDHVSDLSLTGLADSLRIGATVAWSIFRSRVTVDLAEIRVKKRFLGMRLRRARVLNGMPVPRAIVMGILKDLDLEELTVLGGHGIVVLDLRRWLAPELDLRILSVHTTGRSLHVWLGPGELRDLPGREPRALPEGSKKADPTGSLDTEQALR